MRVHLLALPNTQTTRVYALDGFSIATQRFCRVLEQLGATVYLYASEDNDAPCHELITVITKEEQETLLGDLAYQFADIDGSKPLFALSNPRISREIAKRKQPKDIICTIGGSSQQAAMEKHGDLLWMEYSIGYVGSFCPSRVFESYAWRHTTYGFQGIGPQGYDANGKFFDTVIPLFFDVEEFPICLEPDPYYLYCGRLIERKGVQIACDAAKAAGVPLKVIGPGDANLVTYGEYLGPVSATDRNRLLSRALAVLTPTIYVEPFNAVAVEAQLCGTPAISTDWGGFVETIQQGVSGYRCSYLGEFVEAIRKAPTLDRAYIADRARDLYSIEAVVPQYRAFFDRMHLLWGQGFNTVHPELAAV